MGGSNGNLMRFQLEWAVKGDQAQRLSRGYKESGVCASRSPRRYDGTLTAPSEDEHLSENVEKTRYYIVRNSFGRRIILGRGTLGTVFRAIGIDSGQVMVLREINWRHERKWQIRVEKVRGEVDLMRLARHDNIVEFIASQGWEEGSSCVHIFMKLEEGNLRKLSSSGDFAPRAIREDFLKQMLSALSFLERQDFVHGDVKPENILYSEHPDRPKKKHFRLADFGVGKLIAEARLYDGTEEFMAPEILALNDLPDFEIVQTPPSHKVDVWSLFVSLAWAIDAEGYQSTNKETVHQILDAVSKACEDNWIKKYKAMATIDPTKRASAHDILTEHFKGSRNLGGC
ncbi:MAG: hypothetical protein Q9163_004683 [Psora crenata]